MTARLSNVVAPGKLILIGEYAVRHDGPAVVMAVDREARLNWCDPDSRAGSDLVAFARRESARVLGDSPADRCCRVDSSAFFAGQEKLGLGSSAAVVTAAVASVFCEAGRDIERPDEREHLWRTALQIHDTFQGIRGSGLDLAAAVFGGTIAMDPRRPTGQGRFRAWHAPPNLELVFVWTGQPASTGMLLAAVDRYAQSDPSGHAAVIAEMADLADRFVVAEAGPAEKLLTLVDAYGVVMEQLGARAAAPICTPAIAALRATARSAGGAAKPSGAGGGDFVMAAFDQKSSADAFIRRARRMGSAPMDLRPHPRGVHLALPDPSAPSQPRGC